MTSQANSHATKRTCTRPPLAWEHKLNFVPEPAMLSIVGSLTVSEWRIRFPLTRKGAEPDFHHRLEFNFDTCCALTYNDHRKEKMVSL